MSTPERDAVSDSVFFEAKAVEAAVQEAVKEALLAHKRAGNSIVVWRNGRVEWVPAEEIQVDAPAGEDAGPRKH